MLERCGREEVRGYRRAVLRLFMGEWIGGVHFGPLRRFTEDWEPYGLSRDGMLRVWDAVVKTGMVVGAVRLGDGWVMGLSLWAVGKAGL